VEAVGEEAGHEQREIAQIPEASPLFHPAAVKGAAQPEGQRLVLVIAEGDAFAGAHEAAQEVDEVVGRQFGGVELLARQRRLDQLLEVLGWRVIHRLPPRFANYTPAEPEAAKPRAVL
jgi:hypothetical protein